MIFDEKNHIIEQCFFFARENKKNPLKLILTFFLIFSRVDFFFYAHFFPCFSRPFLFFTGTRFLFFHGENISFTAKILIFLGVDLFFYGNYFSCEYK